jgi:hypothetical protein
LQSHVHFLGQFRLLGLGPGLGVTQAKRGQTS